MLRELDRDSLMDDLDGEDQEDDEVDVAVLTGETIGFRSQVKMNRKSAQDWSLSLVSLSGLSGLSDLSLSLSGLSLSL